MAEYILAFFMLFGVHEAGHASRMDDFKGMKYKWSGVHYYVESIKNEDRGVVGVSGFSAQTYFESMRERTNKERFVSAIHKGLYSIKIENKSDLHVVNDGVGKNYFREMLAISAISEIYRTKDTCLVIQYSDNGTPILAIKKLF